MSYDYEDKGNGFLAVIFGGVVGFGIFTLLKGWLSAGIMTYIAVGVIFIIAFKAWRNKSTAFIIILLVASIPGFVTKFAPMVNKPVNPSVASKTASSTTGTTNKPASSSATKTDNKPADVSAEPALVETSDEYAYSAPTGNTGIITEHTKIRNEPNMHGFVEIKALNEGDIVILTGKEKNGFKEVEHKGTSGWVHKGYIDYE